MNQKQKRKGKETERKRRIEKNSCIVKTGQDFLDTHNNNGGKNVKRKRENKQTDREKE